MKDHLKTYRETPLGEQLGVHFKQRAALRLSIPLFSFSVSKVAKRFEIDTGKADAHLQRA